MHQRLVPVCVVSCLLYLLRNGHSYLVVLCVYVCVLCCEIQGRLPLLGISFWFRNLQAGLCEALSQCFRERSVTSFHLSPADGGLGIAQPLETQSAAKRQSGTMTKWNRGTEEQLRRAKKKSLISSGSPTLSPYLRQEVGEPVRARVCPRKGLSIPQPLLPSGRIGKLNWEGAAG